MKQMAQRTSILIVLGVAAIAWTFLMGLGVAPVETDAGTGPGFSDVESAVAGTGVEITFVDDSNFPAVKVYLVANDNNGQPVFGLQRENFSLREDGSPVSITDFTAAGSQVTTVVLVIDRSGSMNDAGKITGAQQAATSFVEHLQPGQDQLGLIVFNRAIDVLEPFATVTEGSKQDVINQIGALRAGGGTEFYRAVQAAIAQLGPVQGRKVVLALTDGLDGDAQRALQPTIGAAMDASVAIYPIGLGSDVDAASLQQLADATGGEYFFSPSAAELEQLYLEIGSNLRNEYSLTYQSATPNLDGTQRNLGVTIQTAGGPLEADSGYNVGGVLAAASLDPVLFASLFVVLLAGLVALYQLPTWLHRPGALSDEPAPAFAGSGLNGASHGPAAHAAPSSHAPPQSTVAMQDTSPGLYTTAAPTAGSTAAPTQAVSTAPAAVGGAPQAPALIQQLDVTGPEAVVGSGANAHVRLTHPSVQAQHARISMSSDRYIIDDLSGGRTQVSFNGDPSQLRPVQRNALRDRSLVQLGEERLIFRQPPAQPLRLERRYPLGSHGVTLGSAPSCDIVLAGTAPHQARVLQDGQRWVVEDLAGGALVSYSGDPTQERPIAGRNALKSGSTLRMGAMTLRLETV